MWDVCTDVSVRVILILDVGNPHKGGYSSLTFSMQIPQLGRRNGGIIALWSLGEGSCKGQ